METEKPTPEDEPEPAGNPSPAVGLFREEALQYHLGEGEEGDVLRLSPAWTRWTYRLLLLVVCTGLIYLLFGRAPVYEAGPAILRVEDRTTLTSQAAGTVRSVEVQPGQSVESGNVLVRFRAEREENDLAKIRQEFELHLFERLRDPSDETAGRELKRLRAEEARLEARLEERLIRAPRDGVVSDVRIRSGQFLERGEAVLSLVPLRQEYTVIILLPGQARPLLAPEMSVRLEIVGYPYAYLSTRVTKVGDQVIGPSEARRFLGPDIADSVGLPGPVVLVECRLPSATFTAWRREYSLHDGMLANAEVIVRNERLLLRLIPGLKALAREEHA